MPKLYRHYVCQKCGHVAAAPFGRCPSCQTWDSMVEEVVSDEPETLSLGITFKGLSTNSKPSPIGEVKSDREERIPLKMEEFSRVLGGGIVPGSIVLISGDPGIGKSTITLQVAMQLAETDRVLYVSGEESERQIKMRADRLAAKNAQNGRVRQPGA